LNRKSTGQEEEEKDCLFKASQRRYFETRTSEVE